MRATQPIFSFLRVEMAEKTNREQRRRQYPIEDAKEQTIPHKQNRQQCRAEQAATSGLEHSEIESRVFDEKLQIAITKKSGAIRSSSAKANAVAAFALLTYILQ